MASSLEEISKEYDVSIDETIEMHRLLKLRHSIKHAVNINDLKRALLKYFEVPKDGFVDAIQNFIDEKKVS